MACASLNRPYVAGQDWTSVLAGSWPDTSLSSVLFCSHLNYCFSEDKWLISFWNFFIHRSLITEVDPSNSDILHMCFAHKKRGLVVEGSRKKEGRRNGKGQCKFPVDI
jgi:hypothetical protein